MDKKSLAKRVNEFIKENIPLANMFVEHDFSRGCDQNCSVDTPIYRECYDPDIRPALKTLVSENELRDTMDDYEPIDIKFRFIAYSGDSAYFDRGMHMMIGYESPSRGTRSYLFEKCVVEHVLKNASGSLAQDLSDAVNIAVVEATDKIKKRFSI